MSSTRFRKRDEALGAVMRDMVTAKYVAEAAGAPHSPKGSQVERCGQYGPLGRHVCQTSQEEPPARLLLLDNAEHRLNQLLPQLVRLFSCRGGHPSAVAPQCRIVRPDRHTLAANLSGSSCTLQRQGTLWQMAPGCPVETGNGTPLEEMLDTFEGEHPVLVDT